MNAPWLEDPVYGGMSPESARRSWEAGQRQRAESPFLRGEEPPPSGPDDYGTVVSLSKPVALEIPSSLCLSYADWQDRALPPADYLMGSWLTTTTRMLLSADTGLGKTNFAVALEQHVAAGVPFLHWPAKRRARVLHVDGEMSRRLLKERIEGEAKRHGGNLDGFHVLSHEDYPFPPLNTPAGQEWMLRLIKQLGIEFVTFDNIMSLTLGDQKDPLVWQQTLPFVLELTSRSVGQLWVHHTGHDKSKGYGDKSREWQMDTVAVLEKVERNDTDVSFSLSFEKARERTPDTRRDFEQVNIALVDDSWQGSLGGSRAKAGRIAPRVQKALEALHNVLAGDQVIMMPGNRRAAHRDHWAAECNRLGLVDFQKPPSARTLMNTFRRDLVAANRIACEEDLQWIL